MTTPTPHHCDRCGAPMVRVRSYPTGRVMGVECYHCAPPRENAWPGKRLLRLLRRYLRQRYWSDRARDWRVVDSRDWRRLLRWLATRGMM